MQSRTDSDVASTAKNEEELREKYGELPEVEEAYVVRLTPLEGDVSPPKLIDGVGWPGVFEFRQC